MPGEPLYPRFAERRPTEALAGSPAVLIHGARQCGKTTLARMVGERTGYAYFTFDDVARGVAEADLAGSVADLPPRVILDELQHVPQLSAGRRFARGVVLYDGEVSAGFGDSTFAVPIRTLWEPL